MNSFIDKLATLIKDEGARKTFQKGELILREGEIEKRLYFIESGAVRVILLSEHEELTIRIGYEGSIINSLYSYLKQSPSEFYIEAVRKTTLLLVNKEKIEQLVYSDPDNTKGYIRLLENLVTQTIEREIDLLTVSPQKRLERVLERSPHLFQHIPLKYIASYLRMTPEHLSRIRNS